MERARTGGMGTKGELWEVVVDGSDVKNAASSSLPGNIEGGVTGNVARELSKTSGEAGFRYFGSLRLFPSNKPR